ncbi:MAG TPA: hypothetical protein VFF84_12185 [Sphingobium sp.]|nr:hypothetical protein [Sphingobium sp.]
MTARSFKHRATRVLALAAATSLAAMGLAGAPALAQEQAPASAAEQPDLTHLPPLPNYQPKKTAWGDPDLRGGWPIDSLGGLPMQRTVEQGNRVFLTQEEYEKREAAMERSRNAAEKETKSNKLGMGNWVEMTGAGRRTSLLIAPANGRLPELTAEGKAANAAGRSSWVRDQTFDWVTDFDSWDRCISRGFPASMMPFRYNNGIRIFQAPGMVVIALEMLGTRVIYTDGRPVPAKNVTAWMGESRGHWEGNTLVVETTNLKTDMAPINMATIGGLPNNTLPTGKDAKVNERFTLADANTLVYEMTYTDPQYWTAPWTIRMDIPRNDAYEFYEYACHEGNVQIRNYINSSRALRAQEAEAKKAAAVASKPAGTAKKK